MYDQSIGDTLALVNIAREAFGAEPLTELPDARTGAPQDCLYFRALSGIGCSSVAGNTLTFNTERQAATVAALWGVQRNGTVVSSPKSIRNTISNFDGDRVSHYNV